MTYGPRSFGSTILLVAALSACSGPATQSAPGTDTPSAGAQAITVQVQPPTVNVAVGEAMSFTANVYGTANSAVTWTVLEHGGGIVNTGGDYRAPSAAGTYHVIATSVADSSASSRATVTVAANPVAAQGGGGSSSAAGGGGSAGSGGAGGVASAGSGSASGGGSGATDSGGSATSSYSPNYYVDCSAGQNGDGSRGSPWNNLASMNAHAFAAADVIAIKTGTSCTNATYPGAINIRHSGSSENPIVYTSYDPGSYASPGTGARPVISAGNAGTHGSSVVNVVNVQGASYVTVDGLNLRSSKEYGVLMDSTASHLTVKNCEITDVSYGFELDGPNTTIAGNYVHDLNKMIVNTGQGGDYGAVCIGVQNSNMEIYNNQCIRCRAVSADYGHDGGCLELYESTSNVHFHHNWCQETMGMFEVAGSNVNDVVAYNVGYNIYGDLLGTIQAGSITNLVVENNTIVGVTGDDPQRNVAIWFATSADGAKATYRNNIITMYPGEYCATSGRAFSHDHNIFWNGHNGSCGDLALGPGDKATDPKFVSSSDMHLQSSSPAINAGAGSSGSIFSIDYDGQAVPAGAGTDIGAYEYQ
jgi:hypothetical protein